MSKKNNSNKVSPHFLQMPSKKKGTGSMPKQPKSDQPTEDVKLSTAAEQVVIKEDATEPDGAINSSTDPGNDNNKNNESDPNMQATSTLHNLKVAALHPSIFDDSNLRDSQFEAPHANEITSSVTETMKAGSTEAFGALIRALDLDSWSLRGLKMLRQQIVHVQHGHLESKRRELAELEKDVHDEMRSRTGSAARRGPAPGTKKVNKFWFRDPDNADNAWNGMGRKPVWVRELEAKGVNLETIKTPNPAAQVVA